MENLSDFLETHFEVVTFINECMENEEHKIYTEIFEQKRRGN